MYKTINCIICNKEVSNRKSLAFGKGRACREHKEVIQKVKFDNAINTQNRAELIKLTKTEKYRVAFLGLDLNRISTIFLAQIFYIDAYCIIDIYSITDELKDLEGIQSGSTTKRVEQFEHEDSPLKGLWKAHFTDSSLPFIYKNMKIPKNLEQGKYENLSDEEKLKLNYSWTVGEYNYRALNNKLTGEWIVFDKYNGDNYYLTIGFHYPLEKDEDIFERVKKAYQEDFSFLNKSS